MATNGPATINLPDATSSDWWVAPSGSAAGKAETLTINHLAGSAGVCTVNTQLSQLLYTTPAGVTSATIPINGTLCLRSNGTGWVVEFGSMTLRNRTRSVVNTDSAAVRTLLAWDAFLSLEGAAGTLTLHAASNTIRGDLVWIRNNASANWSITVADTSTEQIFQTATGAPTLVLSPGQSLPLFNRTSTRWEVTG